MRRAFGFIGFCWMAVSTAAALPPPSRRAPRVPIEVQVEVSEVDNDKASNLGVDWVNAVTAQEKAPAGLVALGAFERATKLQGDLHFLLQEGAAEILANPNLITDSGTTASFHVGGEIPYVTNGSLGTSHVEFKPYGVLLNLQPRLEADGRIELKIKAAVSSPDGSAGVVAGGNAVPALLSREVSSNVTVDPGATMTLAGLVQTHKEEVVRGVPFLRRIPGLGAFFRWRRTNFRRTTIIVFVTPRVAKPNP